MRLLFIVAEDRLFIRHRLELGEELIKRGYKLGLAAQDFGYTEKLIQAGITFFPVPFARDSLSPLSIARAAHHLRKVISQFKPQILHAVALRPVLITHLARRGFAIPVVNAITGMGSLFSGELNSFKYQVTRGVVQHWLKIALWHAQTWNVFQNAEDLREANAAALCPSPTAVLIPGVGVNCADWSPQEEPHQQPPVLLFVGRLLRDKGLRELVEASRILKGRGVEHVLQIAGENDPANPNSFSLDELETWTRVPGLQLLGWRNDVLPLMTQANLIVLPSYREGLPKTLLQAGVAARAVVTSDTIGCREIIKHNENGLLVPPRNPEALADALQLLLRHPQLRTRLASRLREDVAANFSLDKVASQFLDLFQKIRNTDH